MGDHLGDSERGARSWDSGSNASGLSIHHFYTRTLNPKPQTQTLDRRPWMLPPKIPITVAYVHMIFGG